MLKQRYEDEVEFTVTCRMKARWVPHFLGALAYMQRLGEMGSSRMVSFFSDGDGDFRPQFAFDESLPSDAKPVKDENGNHTYDAV
jgi:hypothetical protein